MCLFLSRVAIVRKTQIIFQYTELLHQSRRHGIILASYSNEVKLVEGDESATMVLPVAAIESDIRLDSNDDLGKTIEECFERLKKAFEKQELDDHRSLGPCFGSAYGSSKSATLAVVRAGNYDVSIAPSLDRLMDYDKDVFNPQRNLIDIMRDNYSIGHSFLIFKLHKSCLYHPFTYVYAVGGAEFGSIPTKHYHPGVHNKPLNKHFESIGKNPFTGITIMESNTLMKCLQNGTYADDWDHEIFIIGVPPIRGATKLRSSCQDIAEKLNENLIKLDVSFLDSVQRLEISGFAPNQDLKFKLYDTKGHPGIICDACKKDIDTGYRYKCLTCKDLDICSSCHASKKLTRNPNHDGKDGHPLIEIKDTIDSSIFVKRLESGVKRKEALKKIEEIMKELPANV